MSAAARESAAFSGPGDRASSPGPFSGSSSSPPASMRSASIIFQIVYPPAAHVGPPPVQVGLLVPGTPEADAILRWIDSEDPALAAEPGTPPSPA